MAPVNPKPLVLTYYTPEYVDYYNRLAESLGRTNPWIELVGYKSPSHGSWVKNCAFKPTVILDALRNTRRPLLWLDADATVHGDLRPLFAELAGIDFAACQPVPMKTWPRVNSSLLSGTLYFDPARYATMQLAEAWEAACVADPLKFDQESLAEVLRSMRSDPALYVSDLDPRYVCIPDLMPDVKDPVVIHHQASRTMKDRVG